jgi:hypothetical protein
MCLKNQQIHQLFIQFINYMWYGRIVFSDVVRAPRH